MKRDIAAIKARLDAATPGPWTWTPMDDGYYCVLVGANGTEVIDDGSHGGEYGGMTTDSPDAIFIAHAPADIAALLARVAELEKALAAVGSELAWTKHVADRALAAIGAALIELVNEDAEKATAILLTTIERSEPQP